jgi:hypothetical protein
VSDGRKRKNKKETEKETSIKVEGFSPHTPWSRPDPEHLKLKNLFEKTFSPGEGGCQGSSTPALVLPFSQWRPSRRCAGTMGAQLHPQVCNKAS